MIKINLLPIRASRKKETMRQQVTILVVALVLVLAVGAGAWGYLRSQISTLKGEISASEAELATLKTKIGAIDNLKKLQADVKKKLDVLNRLRRGKTGPASRLAALSETVPDKLWLTKYSETGSSVSLSGGAMSEDLIAVFMKSLQASGSFGNVELVVSEQAENSGVKFKRFDLAFQILDQKP
ncbi:PilN domain-containing protein [Geomonas subterranea]|uniref:PilN domain-containing protein n=1 Tax=Geomonas subterranea TaxID=2847989 RepID=A0ABX8LPN0_9BACT|nr:PilN domain-containing protein [Geomonas subterranea]QXE91485.1 PilN domain-containing protein [Geomonas subterranea]QXM10427.1 PilN domain-containing protein [Geomonas subterranea]